MAASSLEGSNPVRIRRPGALAMLQGHGTTGFDDAASTPMTCGAAVSAVMNGGARMRMLLTTLILSFSMLPAAAQTNKLPPVAESRSADTAKKLCARNPERCKSFRNLESFPAHALSWSGGNLALHYRGVDWTGEPGLMSFTMHRPKAYAAGAPVRLRIVYEVFGAGDRESIGFSINPTSFNHGSGFETYGGESTGLIPAHTGNIQEQSVTLTFPGSYSLAGNWWYFEINRVGESQDKIRLMSVSVEY